MLQTGQPAEALQWLDKAFAVDPSVTGLATFIRCRAYQALGRYDDAIAACEKSVVEDDWWLAHAYLVAAYAQKGETAKAEAEKIDPAQTAARHDHRRPQGAALVERAGVPAADRDAFYAGLRKAGIPEK